MGQTTMSVSFPLDSEGFLRRKCPTCDREFKWRNTPAGEQGVPQPAGGYFCPYCGVQSPGNTWFTDAQNQLIQATIRNEAIVPALRDLQRSLESLNSRSGLVRVTAPKDAPEEMLKPELVEVDDMRRVDFKCHTEPVKISDDWEGTNYCLICGQQTN
jgi:hypothetical protein